MKQLVHRSLQMEAVKLFFIGLFEALISFCQWLNDIEYGEQDNDN